jgi:hypothetical protein
MKGYLNNPQATAETLTEDGWLRTGDLAIIDEDGFMFIRDRLKELIKYKGFQVAPAEVEAALIAHEGVVDAAVIGKPDEEAGEAPVAFVVRAPGSEVGEGDLKAALRGMPRPLQAPGRIPFRRERAEIGQREDPAAGAAGRSLMRTEDRGARNDSKNGGGGRTLVPGGAAMSVLPLIGSVRLSWPGSGGGPSGCRGCRADGAARRVELRHGHARGRERRDLREPVFVPRRAVLFGPLQRGLQFRLDRVRQRGRKAAPRISAS